ncbi:MAG: hypothetical protein U0798_16625 [Gemmataceae bacterium]
MKCPHCGHLATSADRVCFICKKYIGNVRQSDRIGGETNYARLLPIIMMAAGTPMVLMVYNKYVPGASRLTMYDLDRIFLTIGIAAVLGSLGWIVGRLLGDGTTTRI